MSTQEFVVRVPREVNKNFNVMRFGSSHCVDVSKWKQTVMERENNFKEFKTEIDSEMREFGAGSEFGKKQREEAKRKKYTSNTKKYRPEQQPWILKTGGKLAKKYKGIREGGVSENASYYVFFQAPDGAFEAFPVKEWYNFTPIQRYKALTAEEAEEKFEKRDKILNYFSVMINKKRKEDDTGENTIESKGKMKKGFKVSDMDEWQGMDSDNDNDMEDRSDEDIKPKIKKEKKGSKKVKNVKKKKKKGSDDDEDDSEPLEESDEGDFDDKEVDYMSDSSESSEESENEKTNRALKGVEDEDALRQLVISEDEEEEDKEKEESEKADKDGDKSQNGDKTNSSETDKKGKPKSDKLTANFDSPPPSSSDSDSDNSDLDESKSALLIQKKFKIKIESEMSATNSRAATPTANSEPSTSSGNGASNDSNKLKRKTLVNDSPNNLKKPKLTNDNSDGITEDAVRRYLMRKPMTCTDLLQKFKNKVSFKGDLVHTIAQILKRLNPEKQTIKGKLYFSLKPT